MNEKGPGIISGLSRAQPENQTVRFMTQFPRADRETGTFNGIEGVFGLGNVLTGRGNLRESRDNARLVTHSMIKNYLGLEADTQPSFTAAMHARVHQAVTEIVEKAVENQQPLLEARLRTILGHVEKRWHEIGYRGDYQEWLEKRPPSQSRGSRFE